MSRFIDEAVIVARTGEERSPIVRVTLSNDDRRYFNGFVVKQGERHGSTVVLSGSLAGLGTVTLVVRDEDIFTVEVEHHD